MPTPTRACSNSSRSPGTGHQFTNGTMKGWSKSNINLKRPRPIKKFLLIITHVSASLTSDSPTTNGRLDVPHQCWKHSTHSLPTSHVLIVPPKKMFCKHYKITFKIRNEYLYRRATGRSAKGRWQQRSEYSISIADSYLRYSFFWMYLKYTIKLPERAYPGLASEIRVRWARTCSCSILILVVRCPLNLKMEFNLMR